MINKNRQDLLDEAFLTLKNNNFNGWIILPTGSGKSSLLIQTIKYFNKKRIWYLSDSELNRDKTFKKELIKWGCEEYIPKIEFLCYQTAYKLKNEKVDLVLCDEGDFSLTPEYSKVYINNSFEHIVLVSATLSDDKRKIAEIIAPVIYEKNIKEIEDDGILNGAEYYTVTFMLSAVENQKYLRFNDKLRSLIKEKEEATGKEAIARVQKNLDFWISQRSAFMKNLDSSKKTCRQLLKKIYELNNNSKILIFCGLTEQADAVCKYSYHGKNEGENWLDKFDKGEIQALSVVGKADRGLNINGVNTIVFEFTNRSRTKFVQKSGRGRRLDVNEVLSIFFMIPYFKNRKGVVHPTIVDKWVGEATKDLKIKRFKRFKI